MKVALPSKESQVDSHFGHCEIFTIFTIDENKQIVSREQLDPPKGCGCKSNIAASLAQMGVTVVLAGNIGSGALNLLTAHGIRVYRGCSGDLLEVARAWLAGNITDFGTVCSD